MKCPVCGQWNRASLPRCMRCGEPLTDKEQGPSWRETLKDDRRAKEYIHVDEDGDMDVSPDERELLAAEMTELKARKTEGEQQQLHLRRRRAQRHDSQPMVNVRQEEAPAREPQESPEAPAAEERPAPEFAPRDPGARVILNPAQWQSSSSYDPLVEQSRTYNVYSNQTQMPPRHQQQVTYSRKGSMQRIIRLLTIVLVVYVLGLAGFMGYSVISKYMAQKAAENSATVYTSIVDDLAAHTILVPGVDGQEIYISNPEVRSAYPVVGGFATIEIPDHIWYEEKETVEESSMTITLYPFVKTSGGRQSPLSPIVYDISIPLSPIELVTPESFRTEVTTAMYSLTFSVRPGSTIIINGEDVSDAVNEDGLLSYNANVQPIGDNLYTVRVRSPYCRENTMSVTLYREVQEIPLDLAATTYTSTSLSALPITATTLPGAEITVLSPHSDLNISTLDTTGEFTFYAVFDKIGNNTITIEASYPGKKTSRVDYIIYYLPSPDVYTPKAWSLNRPADYAELLSNITYRAANTQIYVAVGVIDHFVSEKPQMAVVYCSDDGKSQPVLLENQSKTTWKVGEYYRIYCDAYGTYDGMPWLIARYTY